VATYLAQGLSPRQIAVLLGISTQVIYYHKYRIEADRKA
jgi:DNA-binding CsgD family transcriptional regulator